MARHYPSYRPDRRRAQPKPNPQRDYVMLRELWWANHPDATHAEYQAAMKEISRKLAL